VPGLVPATGFNDRERLFNPSEGVLNQGFNSK
jgi:hypothetical protein